MTGPNVKDRRGSIGGSDAAAVLGFSPWKTPLDVFCETVGLREPDVDNRFTRWGTYLEEPVAAEYAAVTGNKIERSNKTWRHPEHHWMACHIDRRIVGTKGILEVKTGSAWKRDEWGEPGTDEVPPAYLIQCMHMMAVGGWEFCDVAVLLGGNDFRIYHMKRNEELVESIIEAELRFWLDHVETGIPPDPANNAECALRWPVSQAKAVEADAKLQLVLKELVQTKDQLKALGEHKDELELHIKTALGEADTITVGGKPWATWKTQTRKAFTVPESSMRVLRLQIKAIGGDR